jgi:hypothetical protein
MTLVLDDCSTPTLFAFLSVHYFTFIGNHAVKFAVFANEVAVQTNATGDLHVSFPLPLGGD